MSICVQDVDGNKRKVASRGVGNTALGLAIGALGGTVLNAMGGLGIGGGAGASAPCVVTERDFYETELRNRDREFNNFMSLQQQICDLKAEVAINSTANTYQNMLTEQQFNCVDKQLGWDRLATGYEIAAATCRKIDGQLSLPLNALSNGFKANDNYLSTYSINPPPPMGGFGNNGMGCNGWY